jgi:hypothetical protein
MIRNSYNVYDNPYSSICLKWVRSNMHAINSSHVYTTYSKHSKASIRTHSLMISTRNQLCQSKSHPCKLTIVEFPSIAKKTEPKIQNVPAKKNKPEHKLRSCTENRRRNTNQIYLNQFDFSSIKEYKKKNNSISNYQYVISKSLWKSNQKESAKFTPLFRSKYSLLTSNKFPNYYDSSGVHNDKYTYQESDINLENNQILEEYKRSVM